jgi:hypothetical protein
MRGVALAGSGAARTLRRDHDGSSAGPPALATLREETPMHSRTSLRRGLAALAALGAMALAAAPAMADTAPPADTPTAGGVCLMAKQDVQGSARYAALSASRRASLDRYATDLCAKADSLVASLTADQKASLLAQFDDAVVRAVPQGWLTADQAATLQAAAATL